jgi:hypothetical protein
MSAKWDTTIFSIFEWAQTQKFEDLPINLHLFKIFSKFFGWACAHSARILASLLSSGHTGSNYIDIEFVSCPGAEQIGGYTE